MRISIPYTVPLTLALMVAIAFVAFFLGPEDSVAILTVSLGLFLLEVLIIVKIEEGNDEAP